MAAVGTRLGPIEAERAIVGSLILRADLVDRVRTRLTPGDFSDQRCERLLRIVFRMVEAEEQIDPQTVLVACRETKGLDDRLAAQDAAILIHECIRSAWSPQMIDSYVEAVLLASRRRRLANLGMRLMTDAETEDPMVLAIETMDVAETLLQRQVDDSAPSPSVDMLRNINAKDDWIFPLMLERTDRLLLVGIEGSGKSILLRQLAVCAAAGLHPFRGTWIEPRRVLLVDCENSQIKSAHGLLPMMDLVNRMDRPYGDRFRIELRSAGIDLTKPADAAWLLNRVKVNEPDLLCIGPLYKLHRTDMNNEEKARIVADVLDQVRTWGKGCALVTETHAGHGQPGVKRNLRPKGSQLWLAWPEMVRAIRPISEKAKARETALLETVGRMDREYRNWPEYIRWGNTQGGTLPWLEIGESEYDAEVRASTD